MIFSSQLLDRVLPDGFRKGKRIEFYQIGSYNNDSAKKTFDYNIDLVILSENTNFLNNKRT